MQLLYIDELLSKTKEKFLRVFSKEQILSNQETADFSTFEKDFQKLLDSAEASTIASTSSAAASLVPAGSNTSSGSEQKKNFSSSSSSSSSSSPEQSNVINNATAREKSEESPDGSDKENFGTETPDTQRNGPQDEVFANTPIKSPNKNKVPKHNHGKQKKDEWVPPFFFPLVLLLRLDLLSCLPLLNFVHL